ncbi:DUF2288 domain-containing protein [Synechocystis sp. PCC 7509]|uniref:DUF2288 domain-containing protein n=1 Tax=Synechocystis sp. PCC 7509 TaxID=927677 RepID=UPI0002ACD72D|nr:DUF2288 domain-containing protein [Synechocystis sp. PCC 7509]
MAELRAELAKDLDEAAWEWLIPHVKRDSVLVVAKELNLVEVGIAIASDNLTSVQHWISEQLIQKPSQTQLSDWNSDLQKRFNTLIVQPYVLIQEP